MESDMLYVIIIGIVVLLTIMVIFMSKPKQSIYADVRMLPNESTQSLVAQPVAQVAQPVAQVAQPIAPVAPVAQPVAPVAQPVAPVAPKPLTCVGHADCPGHISGGDSLACQDGICVRQMKDWAGVWYIPKDCVGAPFGPRGSCH